HLDGKRNALIEQAIPLLQRAALVELAEREQADNRTVPDEAISLDGRLLQRLRKRAYPTSARLQLASNRIQEIECPANSRPAPGQIQREWDELKKEANKLLSRWANLRSNDSQFSDQD